MIPTQEEIKNMHPALSGLSYASKAPWSRLLTAALPSVSGRQHIHVVSLTPMSAYYNEIEDRT